MTVVHLWDCRATITRWVDDHQPGFVECRFKDVSNREWVFIEKVPVVTRAEIDSGSQFPQPAFIACTVISWRKDEANRPIARINTERPWNIAAQGGETDFEVFADQLTKSSSPGKADSA